MHRLEAKAPSRDLRGQFRYPLGELRSHIPLEGLLFLLPITLVAVCVAWNPSGAPPPPPESWFGLWGAPLAAVATLFAVGALLGSRLDRFSSALVMLALSWTLAFLLTFTVHRDYSSCHFPFVVLSFAVLFRRADGRMLRRWGPSPRAMRPFAIVFLSGGVAWLCLMSYAIVTRTEPRWVESFLYNCLNAVFLFRLGAVSLPRSGEKTLGLENGRIILDGKDISSLFGATGQRFLIAFMRNGGQASCRTLMGCGSDEALNCKASQCAKYRNAYNGIRDLRTVLEALSLGTISAPVNKNRITVEGWTLELDLNLRVVGKDARNPEVPGAY